MLPRFGVISSIKRLCPVLLLGAADGELDHVPTANSKQFSCTLAKSKCSDFGNSVHVLAFETDKNSERAPAGDMYVSQLATRGRVIGRGMKFEGWSMKWHVVLDYITSLSPQDLVIVTDYRDVLVNERSLTHELLLQAECIFRKITANASHAVVVSAEAQCCVDALGSMLPGQLIDENGSRTSRACASVFDGQCAGKSAWKQNSETKREWIKMMWKRARKTGINATQNPNIFLNAGLVAGRVNALRSLLTGLQLHSSEDDQAVFTEALFRMPDKLVLDYNQELFGNALHYFAMIHMPKDKIPKAGCPFVYDEVASRYIDTITHTCPLFLHTPGGKVMNEHECLRNLAQTFRTRGGKNGSCPAVIDCPHRGHDVAVLAFETHKTLEKAPLGAMYSLQLGMYGRVIGNGTKFEGRSLKWNLVFDYISKLKAHDLVIVTDYRRVLLNSPILTQELLLQAECAFQKITNNSKNAIVVSAEAQCCVDALSRFRPGQLINPNGDRISRAYNSARHEDQHYKGSNSTDYIMNKKAWIKFMREIAAYHIGADSANNTNNVNIFLNNGLVAGRVHSLKTILKKLQLHKREDAQAVFTEALYRMPDRIILDYKQELFANAVQKGLRVRTKRMPKGGCVFKYDELLSKFVSTLTGTCPIFLQTPSRHSNEFSCLQQLARSFSP